VKKGVLAVGNNEHKRCWTLPRAGHAWESWEQHLWEQSTWRHGAGLPKQEIIEYC
jgi:hypothetical protein